MMSNLPIRHFVLGTAGHVNHGKSALVRALTGTDPDRLPEEKARGITIELGFAELNLEGPEPNRSSYAIGIVDVPGHEDFIKNMVSGVGSIDAGLLVVAADDGWMPQTEEHLQILSYLGIRSAVVALSKIDLAVDEPASIASIRGRLQSTALSDAPIIPVSIMTGRGIPELKAAIATTLSHHSPPRDYGKPRLAIDRAFTLKGVGTVVTGTLVGGSLRRDDQLRVYPTDGRSRIRSIQSHGRDVAIAVPGSRVALNLTDLRVRVDHPAMSSDAIGRGDVVTTLAARTSRRFCALLRRTGTATTLTGTGPSRLLKNGSFVRLHHATSAVRARVRFLDVESLQPGEQCVAIIHSESPLLLFARDRFVLRDESQRYTIAGGVVLDPLTRPRSHRRDEYLKATRDVINHPDDALGFLRIQLARERAMPADAPVAQSDFTTEEAHRAVQRTVSEGSAASAGNLIVARSLWQEARDEIRARIAEHHQAHPESTGLSVSEVRSILLRQLRPDIHGPMLHTVAEALLTKLCLSESLCVINGVVRDPSHEPRLPPRLEKPARELSRRLAECGLDPPSRSQLCGGDAQHQAMRFLVASGAAIELSKDVVISAEVYSDAVRKIHDYLSHHGTATVTVLKALVGSNRRVMVPLLEWLDSEGITVRDGNLRRLRSTSSPVMLTTSPTHAKGSD